MSRAGSARPTVLVVDDEPDVADTYALRLRERYDVRVAYDGEAALTEIDETVDAVLLDRRMPGMHGDAVLREIRERGYGCVVIMTTAVDPDLNILELDFDDYLCKPVSGETLHEALDRQLTAGGRDPRIEEFFSLISKIEVLEDRLSSAELAESEEYAQCKRRARELGDELDESVPEFGELVETFRDINRGPR